MTRTPEQLQAEALERASRAREAREALEIIGPRLTEQREAVVREVLGKLRTGEVLDPAYAVQQWLRLHELERLESHFKSAIRQGESVERRLREAVRREPSAESRDPILRHL